MKTKLLSLMTAISVVLMFTGCEKGPCGDPAKDARASIEESISIMNNVDDFDEAREAQTDLLEIKNKYENYYKSKGEEELQKFNEELEKLDNDPEISKRREEAEAKMNSIFGDDIKKMFKDALDKKGMRIKDLKKKK